MIYTLPEENNMWEDLNVDGKGSLASVPQDLLQATSLHEDRNIIHSTFLFHFYATYKQKQILWP
jgi:hypothetical protein